MVDLCRPDYRKSLSDLHDEWVTCTKCELGQRREATGGCFVFGEGISGGIMFIGEGPGAEEEAEGRPFIGKSGSVLRHIITEIGLTRSYISNVVACRACAQAYDTEGNPRYRKNRAGEMFPVIQDQPPTPSQMAACLPRLYEEIYLVDPVLIVSLGAEASKALSRSAISIQAETGKAREIEIPGAGYHPSLTEKKKVWVRKVRGEISMPVEQNKVRYLMLPLMHPSYILQRSKDDRHGNPLQVFVDGMKKVARIYDQYMLEVYGEHPCLRELTEESVQEAINRRDDA